MKKIIFALVLSLASVCHGQSGPSYDGGPFILGGVSPTGSAPYFALTTTGTSGQSFDGGPFYRLGGYNASTGLYYVCGTANPCAGAGGSGGGATFPATNGVVFNTSTTASRNAVYSDIVPLFGGGTCSGFLKSDGTCSTVTVTSSQNIYAANGQVIADSIPSTNTYNGIFDSDSNGAGNGVSGSNYTAVTLLNTAWGMTLNNLSVPGDRVQDAAFRLAGVCNPAEAGNPFIMEGAGTNNAVSGVSAALLVQFQQNKAAIIARCGTPPSGTFQSGNTAIVQTSGTWTADTTYPLMSGLTATAPATLTFTNPTLSATGSFYTVVKQTSSGGAYHVAVNGVTCTDTISGNTSISTTWALGPANVASTIGASRCAGQTPGTQGPITFVVDSGTVTFYQHSIPPTSRFRGISAPKIYEANIIPQQNNANSTTIAQYNAALLSLVKTANVDGYYAFYGDLNSNIDPVIDLNGCQAVGGISGTTLTITSMVSTGCNIVIGSPIAGTGVTNTNNGVPPWTTVTALGTGTGGVGTYTVSISQTVTAGTTLYAGIPNVFPSLSPGLHLNILGQQHVANMYQAWVGAAQNSAQFPVLAPQYTSLSDPTTPFNFIGGQYIADYLASTGSAYPRTSFCVQDLGFLGSYCFTGLSVGGNRINFISGPPTSQNGAIAFTFPSSANPTPTQFQSAIQHKFNPNGSAIYNYQLFNKSGPIASAATITQPTTSLFHITGTATITTMPPLSFMTSTTGGCVVAIADGAWSTATGGNFASAMTAVANTPYQFCYDGSLWYGK